MQVGDSYAACGKDSLQPGLQAGRGLGIAKQLIRVFIPAEMHLAALYRDGGKGFPRDMEQAAAWYRKAAEQGDVTAQATLGVLYSIGQGVLQSDVEAYYWLDLAAAVKGPNQDKYAANRQMVGTHITTEELDEVQERVAKWLAAHPRPAATR